MRFVATRSPCCRSAVTTWRRTGVTGWTSEQRPTPTSFRRSTRSTGSARDADGNFIWPGFGDNSRVLAWIIERLEGNEEARDTAIGRMPTEGELNVDGLDITPEQLTDLFSVDAETWLAEADLTEEYFAQFGDRLPAEMTQQLNNLRDRLKA